MKIFRNAAIAAGVLCGIPCTAQLALSGYVQTAEGKPLRGAHVVLLHSARSVFTDSQGQFSLSSVPAQRVVVGISHIGYRPVTDTLEAGNPAFIVMDPLPYLAGEVVIQATRLAPEAPATFKNLDKEEIERLNMGQDFPFLINWTPSLIATSDAGAGVGYTGLRIRGSDQTRINVTVNGIPINDAESQGVFWVNMPDLASSMHSVQIQRGLGSSTNGSGAFGASINIETSQVSEEAGVRLGTSYGSFNTWMRNVQFETGKLGKGFWMDGRLSAITSDGYIDRASSDLRSYYLTAGYAGRRTVLKAVTFSGRERTYQSWYGTPQSRLENDRQGMIDHAQREGYTDAQLENLLSAGRTYNYYLYENEVDNYGQDHYQLHLNQQLGKDIVLGASLHYTYGSGYFEQFREDDLLLNYGLQPFSAGGDTISSTDLVRRRWLDNHFYGGMYSLRYSKLNHQFTLGGGLHIYDGDHFGEVIWGEILPGAVPGQRYYYNRGRKDDFNTFAKWEYNHNRWNLMADLQIRVVHYNTGGNDNDLRPFDIAERFQFFNPKAGVRYRISGRNTIYLYTGIGNREPVRNDFIDAPQGQEPGHETLLNVELGYTHSTEKAIVNVNTFLMAYRNQLVLTGALNDVGAAVRTNANQSYRAGVEAEVAWSLANTVKLDANLTLSDSRIRTFQEVVYDYTDGFDEIIENYNNTPISFSPSLMGSIMLRWLPTPKGEAVLIGRYVGRQYLDNTGSELRSLDPYATADLKLTYTLSTELFRQAAFHLLVSNITNAMYESNGYTYRYIAGEMVNENFFYPQAGINMLIGVTLGL